MIAGPFFREQADGDETAALPGWSVA